MSTARLGRLFVALAFLPSALLVVTSARAATAVGVSVRNVGTQSTAGVRTFNTEVADAQGFHSTVTQTSRLTVPAGLEGTYLVRGFVQLAGTVKIVRVLKNGATTPGSNCVGSSFGTECTALLDVAAGDWVELYTDDTGATGHASAVEAQNALSMYRIEADTTPGPWPTFPPFPTPNASDPVNIEAFTGEAAAVVQTALDVALIGFGVIVSLLCALLIATGLRR